MIAQIRAQDELAWRYRAVGIWRDTGPLTDLRRWRDQTPDATAILAEEAGSCRVQLTFAEYARFVDRFAGALRALGVGHGDVVVVQLPSRWQVPALMLACLQIGAIFAPVMTTIGPREVERILSRLAARVCVTVDSWGGFDHAVALAEMSRRLPRLQHRVVLGNANPQRGEVSFAQTFERATWEEVQPLEVDCGHEDPDRATMLLFTSGTSGEPKGVMHSMNTLYAGAAPVVREEGLGRHDRFFTAAALTHIFGTIYGTLMPLLTGGAAVIRDLWDPVESLALISQTNVTVFAGAPMFLAPMLSEARRTKSVPPTLRLIFSGATTVPRQLVTETEEIFGFPLRTLWGMTEVAGHTWTRRDEPHHWGAFSDGRPGPGLEISLRSESDISRERPGRLFVRGGGVCLATFGRDNSEIHVLSDHDDGWYDTGDMAVADGRGGIRLMGRDNDRIGGAFMIPVDDVEAALLNHPAIDDVALVGYSSVTDGERACAFIVTNSTIPLNLSVIRDYLTSLGMTQWYQPSRLEVITELPRNGSGKVRKDVLRTTLLNKSHTTYAR